MYVMVGLSLATGMPWEYFADQDEIVVATYLDLLKRGRQGKSGPTPATDARRAQMSG